MTNRLGRLVDRARALAAQLKSGKATDPEAVHAPASHPRPAGAHVAPLHSGRRLLRPFRCSAHHLALHHKLAGHELEWLYAAFFFLSLICLILSLVDFIRDIYRALEATALEVGEDWDKKE